ncbi:MAG: hypothetical protein AAF502_15430 [Bacteroidota bacterium]
MKNNLFIGICLSLIVGLGSCDLVNPAEQIPSYIHIEPYTLTTTPFQGSDSHRITDAWVGVDGQLIGAYFLPATIPVLAEGSTEITIFAGVIENGISATREIYPFFQEQITTVDLAPIEIDTIAPATSYRPEAQFVFIEDFEASNLFGDDLDGNPASTMSISSINPFEGQSVGRISMIDDGNIAAVGTAIRYVLPKDGTPIFLELNYRCEVDFSIGIIGYSGGTGEQVLKLTLTARDEWNKVYVSLDQEVIAIDADQYQIYFQAEKASTENEANVYLDNIKLLHL